MGTTATSTLEPRRSWLFRHNTAASATLGLLAALVSAGAWIHHNQTRPVTAYTATVTSTQQQTSFEPCPTGTCPVDTYRTTATLDERQITLTLPERPNPGQPVRVYPTGHDRYSDHAPTSDLALSDVALGSLLLGTFTLLGAGSCIARWA